MLTKSNNLFMGLRPASRRNDSAGTDQKAPANESDNHAGGFDSSSFPPVFFHNSIQTKWVQEQIFTSEIGRRKKQ